MRTETTLFYVIEEALANVARHSGSATAVVRLIRTLHGSLVEVADEGVGIPQWPVSGDISDLPFRGIGLASMRARVGSLGGEVRIRSGALGTKIRVLVSTESGSDGAKPKSRDRRVSGAMRRRGEAIARHFD